MSSLKTFSRFFGTFQNQQQQSGLIEAQTDPTTDGSADQQTHTQHMVFLFVLGKTFNGRVITKRKVQSKAEK